MVNSGSFDSDVDRNEKDGFTQYSNVVESPQSVVSMLAVSGSLCENDFTTQTADSLPVSQAIEPTATKTEYKCNMSEEFVRVSDNCDLKCNKEKLRDGKNSNEETQVATQSKKSEIKHSFIADDELVDRFINMGYLRKYKIETKPSICCSVPLERIPNVLKACGSIIANKTLMINIQSSKEVVKKDMCLYCNRSFLIPNRKQKHMTRFHSSKFNKRLNLRKQITTCWYCDLDSGECNLKQLFSHLVLEHPDKYFGCLDCETRFPTSQALESHRNSTHHNISPLRNSKNCPTTSENADSTLKEYHTTKSPPVSDHAELPNPRTKVENKKDNKVNQTSISEKNSVKTKRKCQSKYLVDVKCDELNAQLPDPAKSSENKVRDDVKTNSKIKPKSKLVKDIRNKKLSVISTKVGMKHCLRITRQRSKILENAKNSKKRISQATQKSESNITTKYLPYPNNSCSPFDISYRVKKITDHSIDNLRISSLTFDDVFDKAFFNRVKCNIQENLLNYVDGKLFKSIESENRISSFQKTKDIPTEDCNSNSGYKMTSSASTTSPDLSIDSHFGEDNESPVDTATKSTKKKPNVLLNEGVPCKYFTRRKYQAVISERKGNKDLSKLDIWTQLVMKNRQQKIISDKKTDKEMIEYKKSDEYKQKMQLEELNGILDKRGPLEDLKEEAMRTVALEKLNSTTVENNMDTYFDVTIILNDILNNLFPKETSLNLLPLAEKESNGSSASSECSFENVPQGEELLNMFNLQRISHFSRVNAIENVFCNEIGNSAVVELTGEWARTRMYVCAACGMKMPNAKLLVDHKNLYHENVWCQHYEFVGNQGELYRHLSIPGLGKIGAIEDKLENGVWRKSDARVCSKCNKHFNCLGDLHRHMLECGGDLSWMLERKKYKYRPYGSKPRKKRRGLLRLLQSFRNQTREKRKKTIKKFNGPRQKPSDADTIQRMLANLPAKRTTRKVISLKDGFPRNLINKKIIKTKKKPLRKENKTIVKHVSTTTNNGTNINRTRRLLRSNSSILLENKLILPRFKRKNNDNSADIIRRHSLRTNIPKKFLNKNPIVSTCKLTDEQIKSLTKNEFKSTCTSIKDSAANSGAKCNTAQQNIVCDEIVSQEIVAVEKMQKNECVLKSAQHSSNIETDRNRDEDNVLQLNGKINVQKTEEENVNRKEPTCVKSMIKTVQKKKGKRKQKSKIETEKINTRKMSTENKTKCKKFQNKTKINHTHKINTNVRKLRLRNTSIYKKMSIHKPPTTMRKKKKCLMRNKVTEIVQVDGSSQSKSVPKNNFPKKEIGTLSNQNSPITINNIQCTIKNPEDLLELDQKNGVHTHTTTCTEADGPSPNKSDKFKLTPNTSDGKMNNSEIDEIETDVEKFAENISLVDEAKNMDNKLANQIPPKKGMKKIRGLNDCIAMLTNKLQDKNLQNNCLELSENRSETTSEKSHNINTSTSLTILNLSNLDVKSDTHVLKSSYEHDVNISNSSKQNSLHQASENKESEKQFDKEKVSEVIESNNLARNNFVNEVEERNKEMISDECSPVNEIVQSNAELIYNSGIESEIYKELNESEMNKQKTKRQRRKSRKKQLFKSISDKLVISNDKLQEIQAENNDAAFNGTKTNSDYNITSVENKLKQDNTNNDIDKFSNSEKENAFSILKISKSKKVKRKFEKVLQPDYTKHSEISESIPSNVQNHIVDVINAVATNEFADSDDELPLSRLIKKREKSESSTISTNENTLNTHILDEATSKSINEDKTKPMKKLKVNCATNKSITNSKIIKQKRKYSKRRKRKCIDNTCGEAISETLINQSKEDVTMEDIPKSVDIPEENVQPLDVQINEDISSVTVVHEIQFETEQHIAKDSLEHSTNIVLPNSQEQQTELLANITLRNNTKPKVPFKRKPKKMARRNKIVSLKVANKLVDDLTNLDNIYCDICNKTFRRNENLLKHKRTLTHIAKLSQLEAFQSVKNAEEDNNVEVSVADANVEVDQHDQEESFQNIESVTCNDYSEHDISRTFNLGASQDSLKLVDIINDVLSKPVDSEYVEHRNFSNLILQTDPEIKRCKSLGERKSFDCDKLKISNNANSSPIRDLEHNFDETKITNTAADIIVEKQISLLENMIEDNRNTFNASDKLFTSSKLPITEEYSCQSNSSAFSMLSNSKQEDLHEITFTHNTNIITNLIKPNLEDHLIPSAHYEQISDDSNSSHFQIEEQKSRKVLNRDEELFLECCSLLKSSSEVSDLCRKSVKSTTFLNNFGLRPLDELEWMDHKQLPARNAILEHTTANVLNVPQTNTPLCDSFYNDLTYSNVESSNLKIFLEKGENGNFFSQAPIFEDISTESDDSSKKSLLPSKSIPSATNEPNFTVQLNNEDRSSPNVESAQIPCDGGIDSVDKNNTTVKLDEEIFDPNVEKANVICNSNEDEPRRSPLPIPSKKMDAVKIIQSNITDYVVTSKVKKPENKKFVTKGALKVFEGLKVSIPKDELDMKEVLSCSPTSKRLEIEAEQDKVPVKKSHAKKEGTNHNFILHKIIRNGKKLNNKLGLKVTKKIQKDTKISMKSKINKLNEIDKKSHDVYDFEETQDSVDIFIKNSDCLPDYHSFKNKITTKAGNPDDIDNNSFSKTSKSKDDIKKSHKCNIQDRNIEGKKLKVNKCITKKKCMIMGRIFKNALKSKTADDIKNIPVMDNSRIVEDFVMNCQNIQTNSKSEKHKLSEEEMNLLFDSLLNEGNSITATSKNNVKVDVSECETSISNEKYIESKPRSKMNNKCKKRQKGNSSDLSDEEFSIKKSSKKPLNKKLSDNDCVINLEQELKECIGVASRKSQRKCTSGKQNVLVEYWSSDESNFGFDVNSILDNKPIDTKELDSNETVPSLHVNSHIVEDDVKNDDISNSVDDVQVEDLKSKEMKKRCFKSKHFRRKKAMKLHELVDECDLLNEENDPETIPCTRQKRNAVDTLYYWSSSSEDEMQDIIEVKSLREDCEDEDRLPQQGWIVGDSPKKLVTMLAQAKGKKLDVDYVKKNRKKRTTV